MTDPRQPPHDHTAEQAVLGAMLLSDDAIAAVTELLRPDDVHDPRHAQLYQHITDRYGRGEPTHPTALAAALPAQTLTSLGGASYLHDLIAGLPTAANASYYAHIVADKARLRRLIEAGTRIVQDAYQAAADATEYAIVRDRATQAIHDATVDHTTADAPPVKEIITATLAEIEAAANHTGAIGMPTGLPDLDDLTGGLIGGQLVVLAGRPGAGKSVLGMGLAQHCALRLGKPAYVANLEMGRTELMKRTLSAETSIPFHQIRRGHLTDDEWTRLARASGDISDAPLHIDDNPDQTVMTIRAKARRLAQREPLGLVVVDYLQLLTPVRRKDSREQEVAEMSRGLKLLGKELDVPVVAIAQLNRGPEQRSDKRPMLSDLRESGALEQDADLVLLLFRPDYYDKESVRAGEVDIDVAKNRNGPTDTVTAAAQLHLMRLVSMIAA